MSIQCKIISSMEKIMGLKEPTGEGISDSLTILQKETASWQVAYFWDNNRKERAKITVESPIADFIEVRSVDSVPCEYVAHPQYDENYLTILPGIYPDLLSQIPSCGISLVPGHWKSIWVNTTDTAALDAGTYPVTIQFWINEECAASSSITVKVLNASLPKLPIRHTEWFHSDCLANYYNVEVFSEEHWQILENFIAEAARRNCNMLLTPVFTPPLDTAKGGERRTVQLVDVTVTENGYTFGFDRLRRWSEICRRQGIEYLEISHLFSQWGARMAPKIMGYRDGNYVQLFGWDTKADGEEYSAFLHSFLTALKPELADLGWTKEQIFFHLSDEPGIDDLEPYRCALNVVAQDLEGYQIIDALSDYSFYQNHLVKQPICSLNHIEPFLENRPEKLWGYYCTAQYLNVSNRFIAMPGCRTRILGTMLYKYDLYGFLHWGFNFYNSDYSYRAIDPYRSTDSDNSFPAGDPFLVYPGADGKPEESIRIMLMDEAMNDLRAMKLLENLKGRDAVMNCIEKDDTETITFSSYPCSITYMATMRKRINDAIEAALS